jgi:hypothetical protein
MTRIEHRAPTEGSRRVQTSAALRRLHWGARWIASFRGESGHDSAVSLRPEDVARGEVFYRSTGCWV